ncbi:hypothetical protein ACLBNB_02895 [Pseudomonas chlororaphis subsp. aurantiaca]|uniref:hypothetical protein n=1 Tax=Pseudomonas chlororaphis TaxID=587753 RepID=UPI00398AAA15
MRLRFPRQNENLCKAALLLATIKNDPERLDLLLELQRFLLRRIMSCEKRISRLQRGRGRISQRVSKGRLDKAQSQRLKRLISDIDDRVCDIRDLMFTWRCFGDGIAATYQSKYALKHLFYDESYNIKQSAGNISGKSGLRLEYKVLRRGILSGIPVVLSDLTNIIRHGDTCFLDGEDPLSIELKSSSKLSKRARRQIEQLCELSNFYVNDGAEEFRGNANVQREALISEEINYLDELNSCMDQAMHDGIATISPEIGVRYIAVRHDKPVEEKLCAFLDEFASKTTHCIFLAPDERWLPLYPFTLSMSPENSILFVQQIIGLMVLIDTSVLKSLFLEKGVHAICLMDGTYSLQICVDPEDLTKGVFRLSRQIYSRIAYEFQSLRWFANEHSELLQSTKLKYKEIAPSSEGIISSHPPEWAQATDCFES